MDGRRARAAALRHRHAVVVRRRRPRRGGPRPPDLVVSYDLFLNDTARRFADVVLPGTSWLEELGCKSTNTHLYLMEKALRARRARRAPVVVGAARARAAARHRRLLPVGDATRARSTRSSIIRRPGTPRWRRCARRAACARSRISHVAHPDLAFPDAVGQGRALLGARRRRSACRRCRCTRTCPRRRVTRSSLRQGRTLTHFHGFYDHGRALPSLAAARSRAGAVDLARRRGRARRGATARRSACYNERGELRARARVTDRDPAPARCGCATAGTGSTTSPPATPSSRTRRSTRSASPAGQAAFDAAVEVAPV